MHNTLVLGSIAAPSIFKSDKPTGVPLYRDNIEP